MQIRLGYVLWSHLAEDLTHGPVALTARRDRHKASPAPLRKTATRCPEHGRRPDTDVGRCSGDAHPLFREIKRFGDAPLALGAVPDRVLKLGTGVM